MTTNETAVASTDTAAPAAGKQGYDSLWSALRNVAFKQDWIDIDGINTRYVQAGDPANPALVLIHGTGGHWETFARNLGPLSEHFNVLALDMVGNGFSDKPDYDWEIDVYVKHVLATLDALGITKAHFSGTSLGSWVVTRIAHDHPERVGKLILMSATGLTGSASNMARIKAERTRAVMDNDWDSIKALFVNLLADESNRLDDLVALRQAIYAREDTRSTINRMLALQDPETRERSLVSEAEYGHIQAPTMIVASGKDFGEYAETSRKVAELMPNARLLEMPSVKHWPHFEDAETFNAAAIEFLKDV